MLECKKSFKNNYRTLLTLSKSSKGDTIFLYITMNHKVVNSIITKKKWLSLKP